MDFFTGFLRTIILLGAVQGFILGTLLIVSSIRKKQASYNTRLTNRLLSILLFLVSLACLKLYAVQQGWFDAVPILRLAEAIIPMIVIMPIGPLIFFYIKSSLNPDFRLTRKDIVHFLPVIIDVVPQLTALIYILGIVTHIARVDPAPWGRFIDTYNVYADIPRWISVTLYVRMAAHLLKKEASAKPNGAVQIPHHPTVFSLRVKWLQQFVRLFQVFQVIWLLYLVPYIIPRYTDQLLNWLDWYPVYVPMAVLTYWLGIKGYMIAQQELPAKKGAGAQLLLTAAEVEDVINTLEKSMVADKLYLNPTLSVSELAMHASLPQKTISAVLNQHMNKSFSEFVNHYRIHALQERLLLAESKDLTIAGLAYECGFNSQPTFQRAFKAVTGLSPTAFLSTCRSSSYKKPPSTSS